MKTQTKIIKRFGAELTREPDPVKAAWNTCHSLAEEARAGWGDEAAETVFAISASAIREWMSVVANAMTERPVKA